jgi:hypothetical protein
MDPMGPSVMPSRAFAKRVLVLKFDLIISTLLSRVLPDLNFNLVFPNTEFRDAVFAHFWRLVIDFSS